jgi:molybdopterin/thiamine biosynthesis adenylyltransferase
VNAAVAIDRTVRLLRSDLFAQLEAETLAEELTATSVMLRADAANLTSMAAQSALTTTYICLAQMGIAVSLDLPDVAIASPQPPLRGESLPRALRDLGDDLITPSPPTPTVEPSAIVLLGDTPAPGLGGLPVLRIGGGPWSARVGVGEGAVVERFDSKIAFGAVLAGAACSAEVLRITCAAIAAKYGIDVPSEFDLGGPREVEIDLPPLDLPPGLDLGAFDIVSAGAITNACMFMLLRVAGLRGSARVIDADIAEETNLNRYPLLRRSQLGLRKVDLVAAASTEGFQIAAVPRRLTTRSIEQIGPLRRRVLVGVDDIPSRWLVQAHCEGWLCVAGTSHFMAMVSEHAEAMPCAGCLHPQDEQGGVRELPTISFVSLVAGTLQAFRLLAHACGGAPLAPSLAACFNLSAPRALTEIGLTANPLCPVGCRASRSAATFTSFATPSPRPRSPAARTRPR